MKTIKTYIIGISLVVASLYSCSIDKNNHQKMLNNKINYSTKRQTIETTAQSQRTTYYTLTINKRLGSLVKTFRLAIGVTLAQSLVNVANSVCLVGNIYIYPTSEIPDNYLECNGSEYKMTDYPDLYNILGGIYGERSENGIIYFSIPDYRGYFLRGWDHGAGNDPDVASRLDRGDELGGDNVGTKQNDAFQGHFHSLYSYGESIGGSGGAGWWENVEINNHFIANNAVKNPVTDGNSAPRTSIETRPININVMYLICAKSQENEYANKSSLLDLQQNLQSTTQSMEDEIEYLKLDYAPKNNLT